MQRIKKKFCSKENNELENHLQIWNIGRVFIVVTCAPNKKLWMLEGMYAHLVKQSPTDSTAVRGNYSQSCTTMSSETHFENKVPWWIRCNNNQNCLLEWANHISFKICKKKTFFKSTFFPCGFYYLGFKVQRNQDTNKSYLTQHIIKTHSIKWVNWPFIVLLYCSIALWGHTLRLEHIEKCSRIMAP